MTSHLSRSCSRPVICDVSCTWARPPGATTMRRLLSTTALSTTAALALGFSLRSGAFVRLCFLAFVRLRFLGVVRPLCVGRSPSSVRRPGRVRFARRRAASRQNCIAEADVHVPRDDEPVRRLRRLSGRKEAEGVLVRLHGDGFPNSRARTACASSRLLDRRRVRRRRRVCRGAAHIPRHRNETRKPRAHSRRRPQRLNPLGGGHAPKNIRGRKRPRRSLAG